MSLLHMAELQAAFVSYQSLTGKPMDFTIYEEEKRTEYTRDPEDEALLELMDQGINPFEGQEFTIRSS